MRNFAILYLILGLEISMAKNMASDLIIIGNDTFPLPAAPFDSVKYKDEAYSNADFKDLKDFRDKGADKCQNGYQSIWKVDSNKFLLAGIRDCQGINRLDLNRQFNGEYKTGFPAFWFTGELRFSTDSTTLGEFPHWKVYDIDYSLFIERGLVIKKISPFELKPGWRICGKCPSILRGGPTLEELDQLDVK